MSWDKNSLKRGEGDVLEKNITDILIWDIEDVLGWESPWLYSLSVQTSTSSSVFGSWQMESGTILVILNLLLFVV